MNSEEIQLKILETLQNIDRKIDIWIGNEVGYSGLIEILEKHISACDKFEEICVKDGFRDHNEYFEVGCSCGDESSAIIFSAGIKNEPLIKMRLEELNKRWKKVKGDIRINKSKFNGSIANMEIEDGEC